MDGNAQGPTTGVTAHLTIADRRASEAIGWYVQAFAAEERMRVPHADGERVMHAHLIVNGGSLLLADDFPEHYGRATAAPAAVTMHLQVDDADRWFARAVDTGASVLSPIDDMFWGDRYGEVTDPFGHSWSIGSALKR